MASSSAAASRSNTRAAVVWSSDEHLGTFLLRNRRGFTSKISLYGAQVISWKNAQGEEMLFLSSKAIFQEGELIGGGIPICFPEHFDRHEMVRDPPAFASKSTWKVDKEITPFQTSANNDGPFIDLILTHPEFYFEIRLKVLLNSAGKLIMTTRVRNTNTNGRRFEFTFAYHNYLSVSDLGEVRVEGLETLHCRDYLKDKELFTAPGDAVTFESEEDQLYQSTNHHRVAVLDHSTKRTIIIRTELPDIVVGILGLRRQRQSLILTRTNTKKMLCVRPARMEKPIKLKPGEEWKGIQELMAQNNTAP